MSERPYENNYGGAVKRLNAIEEKLAELNYDSAPGFLINGLKREQLIATNSMILHELFFDGLGEQSEPGGVLLEAIKRDFGPYERWRSEFIAMGSAWSVEPTVGKTPSTTSLDPHGMMVNTTNLPQSHYDDYSTIF